MGLPHNQLGIFDYGFDVSFERWAKQSLTGPTLPT